MTEMSITLPAKINGAIITRDIIYQLVFMQTKSGYGGNTVYDNSGTYEIKSHLNDILHFLVKKMVNEGINTDEGREILTHIESVYWVHSSVCKFLIPDEFMNN